MKTIGWMIVALVTAYGAYVWINQEAPIRYRVKATIESGGQTYTSSGVIDVRMTFQEYWSPPAVPHVTGDAVVVEVPGRAPVFFLLTSEDKVDWDAYLPFDMFWDRVPPPLDGGGVRADVRALLALRETASIPRERYPLIVAFRDLARPDSVYEVFPDDLSPPLDAGARVVSLTIEMTRDPPTTGIEERLPWLVGMGGTLDGRSIHVAGGPLANALGAAAFMKRGL